MRGELVELFNLNTINSTGLSALTSVSHDQYFSKHFQLVLSMKLLYIQDWLTIIIYQINPWL